VVSSMIAVVAIAGCGGGGGGSPAPIAPPIGSTPTPSPVAYACNLSDPVLTAPSFQPAGQYQPATGPIPSPIISVSGTARFASVPYAATGGALDYAGTTEKPIRGAVVELVDSANNTVVSRNNTDSSGNYTLDAQANRNYFVRVRAQLYPVANGEWNFAVRDNTQGNAMYAISSPAFAVATTPVTGQNLTAASGWTGTNATGSYNTTRAAGPFAILDAVYTAYTKVLAVAPSQVFPPLDLFWSKDNRPVSGNLAAGEITTSFFRQDPSSGNRAIYILGAANTDTDEYDVSVVAHEWGHYFQNAFSRDDSVGGEHSGGQFLDMRVAFSEGWGNAWSGMALNIPYYADSNGTRQQSGFRLDLSQPVAQVRTPGWYKEDSIQYILFSLHQQVGFAPLWQTMSGTMRGGTATTSIHAFAKNFNTTSPANAAALNSLLSGQQIATGLNECGTGETNAGSVTSALPIYRSLIIGQTQQICISSTAGIPNKLGNFAYLGFTAPASRQYTFSVTGGPAGSDPDFEVFQRGYLGGGFGTNSGSEVAASALQAGEAVIAISDANLTAGQSPCFTVQVQ
jgi:hypothetical protein